MKGFRIGESLKPTKTNKPLMKSKYLRKLTDDDLDQEEHDGETEHADQPTFFAGVSASISSSTHLDVSLDQLCHFEQ